MATRQQAARTHLRGDLQMIGSLGNAVFQVSTDRVFTFRNLARSGTVRLEEHNVIGRKPVLEYIGPGLDQISFSVRLDRFLGVDPEKELERIREAKDAAQELPLIVGGKYLGRWIIAQADESHARHDGSGRLLVADVALTLREVSDNGSA